MPGVPAVTAVLIAAGCALVGFIIDATRGSELTRVFSVLFFLGCVAAAIVVRYRGLFTAVVQPPLVLFIAVPLAYQCLSKGGRTSFKDILLNVAIPLVNRFPLMLVTTLVVLGIGAVRYFLARQETTESPARSRRRRAPRPTPDDRAAKPRTGPRPSAGSNPSTPRNSRVTPPPPRTRREAAPRRGEQPRRAAQPPRTVEDFRRAQPPRAPQPQRMPPPPPRTVQPPRPAPRERRVEDLLPPSGGRRVPGSRTSVRSHRDVPGHPIPNVRYRDERPH